MSTTSLETERQAILDRMQKRRESYRRMLIHGSDSIDQADQIADMQTTHTHPVGALPAHDEAAMAQVHSHAPQYASVRRPVPTSFPRSTLMRTVTEHPYLCALGVAAVVLIGPRRIARYAVSASTTVTALAAGNQSNTDMVGKLLAMAGAYVQGRSNDNRS